MGATIIIYMFLLLFTIWGAYISSKYEIKKPIGIVLGFILFIVSVIIGGRYNVGTDWENYFDLYTSILDSGITLDGIIYSGYEPLYVTMNALFAFFDLSPSIFFTGVALLQFVLLCYAVENKRLLLWVFFFFFTQLFAMTLNIQRQMIAVGFFLLATKYLDKNKIVYLLLIACASLFHYSSIILFPLVFINHRLFSFLEDRRIVLILFFITLIFGSSFLGALDLSVLDSLMNDKYLRNMEELDIEMKVSSGLGIMAQRLMYIVSICYMPSILNYYKSNRLSIVYRLFIVGLLLANIFEISMFLSRVPLALVSLKVLIYSYLCNYLFKSKKNTNTLTLKIFIGICFVTLSFMMLIMGIMNSDAGMSPYEFKWI